jgi:hypothetical protein
MINVIVSFISRTLPSSERRGEGEERPLSPWMVGRMVWRVIISAKWANTLSLSLP